MADQKKEEVPVEDAEATKDTAASEEKENSKDSKKEAAKDPKKFNKSGIPRVEFIVSCTC